MTETDLQEASIASAIRYSRQLEKDWNTQPPTMINLHKLICYTSITISSVAQDGRRKITISGDEADLRAFHQFLVNYY